MRPSWLLPSLGCLLLVACSSVPDAEPAADAGVPEGDGGSADAGPADAGAPLCDDVSGAWLWTGSCDVDPLQPDVAADFETLDCIVQEGCALEVHVRAPTSGVEGTSLLNASASGDRVVVEQAGVTCTLTFEGDAATQVCVNTEGTVVCEGTAVRVKFPGATSYCCDVARAGACGANERCTPIGGNGGSDPKFNVSACVPNGTLAEGEACTRTGGRVGADDCGPGLFCANFGRTSASDRVCQRLCTRPDQCHADETCRTYDSLPQAGVCGTSCELLGTDCPGSLTCRPYSARTPTSEVETAELYCDLTGSVAPGGACSVSTECTANHTCSKRLSMPGSTACHRVCDATDHPCDEGFTCVGFSGDNPQAIGSCFPE